MNLGANISKGLPLIPALFLVSQMVFPVGCQQSNGSGEQQQPAVFRIAGEVTVADSVERFLVLKRGNQKTALFLFLTKACPGQVPLGESLVSELQIPEAYTSTSGDTIPGVPFEFLGLEEGVYYLSGFANVEKGGFVGSEYGPGDLAHFDNGTLGCARIELEKNQSVGQYEFQLNYVVKLKDTPAFIM